MLVKENTRMNRFAVLEAEQIRFRDIFRSV